MMKLLYLGYYDTQSNLAENRYYALSACNKMDYICSALNRAGWDVEIVSASGTKNQFGYPGKSIVLSDHTNLTLFPTLGRGCKLKRLIALITQQFNLFSYLLHNIKHADALLTYHSLGYARILRMLKKIKGFCLILEVNEIHADVSGEKRLREREMRLFGIADAFLFSTEMLNNSINSVRKPYLINYGTYQTEEVRNCSFVDPELFGKINIVYAGTFDPRKGGAVAAAAAEFLDENYHIHILGFGSERDKEHLIRVMAETRKKTKCGLSYDGLLSGEEYIRFIQSCDIGLSTQNPDASFNTTSFPSKVLSYMANGLRVVSVRIEAVERSAVGDLITYYDQQTPESIAKAIKSVDFSKEYDSRARIRELDAKFRQDIERLIEAVHEVH